MDIAGIRRFPDWCAEEVTRKGELQPCDRTAVAVRIDPEGVGFYPVCVRHARGDMVPLRVVMAPGDRDRPGWQSTYGPSQRGHKPGRVVRVDST